MSTYRLPILNFATIPDTRLTTGNVIIEPMNVNFGSNNRFRHMLVRFLDTATKDGLAGKFKVPKNFVSSAKIIAVWAATVTSGSVVWEFDYNKAAAGATLDPSTDLETPTVTTATNGTARIATESSISLTSANFSVDDEVLFLFSRLGSSGSDTMASNAYLFSLLFEYADV